MKVKKDIKPFGEVTGHIHSRRLKNGEKVDFFLFKRRMQVNGHNREMYVVNELTTGLNVTTQINKVYALYISEMYFNQYARQYGSVKAFADAFNKAIKEKKKQQEEKQ